MSKNPVSRQRTDGGVVLVQDATEEEASHVPVHEGQAQAVSQRCPQVEEHRQTCVRVTESGERAACPSLLGRLGDPGPKEGSGEEEFFNRIWWKACAVECFSCSPASGTTHRPVRGQAAL